jgi:hypothetical protein
MAVTTTSRKARINLDNELINTLEEMSIEYKIN